MHLLDTDTLRYLHSGHPKVVRRLSELHDPKVGITVITQIEMLRGRFDFMLKAANAAELIRAQELLTRTQEQLERTFVVPLDVKAVTLFDRLRATKGLKKIGRADLLIACIALANDATLVLNQAKPPVLGGERP